MDSTPRYIDILSDSTGETAEKVVRASLLQFPGWTLGGVVLVGLALYGLWRNRRAGAAVWSIVAIGLSFVIGYAFFWSPYSIVKLWPGARTMGPFYHLPLLIPLAVFAAAGLVTIPGLRITAESATISISR